MVTAESANLSDTHGKWGMVPGWGMSVRLPKRVGLLKAKEMMFTGLSVDGAQADPDGARGAGRGDRDARGARGADAEPRQGGGGRGGAARMPDALPGMKWLNPKGMVEDFAALLTDQLDPRIEARNLARFNAKSINRAVVRDSLYDAWPPTPERDDDCCDVCDE